MTLRDRERLGLALLTEALKRPSGDCLPDHPVALLIPSHEEHHDVCHRPSACATVARSSRNNHRVLRRPGQNS